MDVLRDAAGADEGSCRWLRERHGEYLDGLLPPTELAQVLTHLEECVACARYDRVLRRGLELARHVPELRPADDFELRLQHRIFHLQDGNTLGQQRAVAGVGVAAALASVIALIAWSPFLILEPNSAAAVAGDAGTMIVGLPPAEPLGTVAVGWYPGHIPAFPTQHRAVHPTVFPGPYSPLIVNPPVHGGPVRTIATEYRTLE